MTGKEASPRPVPPPHSTTPESRTSLPTPVEIHYGLSQSQGGDLWTDKDNEAQRGAITCPRSSD